MNKTIFAWLLFRISIVIYGIFWAWAIAHASRTPKASVGQRVLWSGAMFINPATAMWYWYIWKRWAFWTLFTPFLGVFVSLPFVVKSLLSKADATNLTNALFALGTSRFVVLLATLLIFPLILRLASLLHLGRNTDLSAFDRNDWVISFALPVFGFGAGMAYCSRYQRKWALAGLCWLAAMALSSRLLFVNISQALIPAGEERREEFIDQLKEPRLP